MKKLRIADRTFILDFNMLTLDEIDEENGGSVDLKQYAETHFSNPRAIAGALPTILRANNEDVPNERWFKSHMTGGMATAVTAAVMSEFIASMRMETESGEDEEYDEVLSEIQKKDRADG